ncbi:hypothetical protein G5714_001189 [Onychostoma macrolepis]|uniref:Uncharacterized protein n=1 Tax=Onychostoma macrolepis TaxID=369639 RepID=A0A7J6DIN8_9TELE|nr:hypothetical protein G5714_001189 [Onychostoma macrolepis]
MGSEMNRHSIVLLMVLLEALGADPVQAPAQGTIDFPAQAGRPTPDKKKADGNAVSLSAPSPSRHDSRSLHPSLGSLTSYQAQRPGSR